MKAFAPTPKLRIGVDTSDGRHAELQVERGWADEQLVAGLHRWRMAVGLFSARNGFDTVYREGDTNENVISLRLSGADVVRTAGIGAGRRLGSPRQLSWIAQGSDGGWHSPGPIQWAHLYIPDGLKTLWEDAWREDGAPRRLCRDDLTFFEDDEIAMRCFAYVTRAIDSERPPSALEMDSRAHLIGMHMLSRFGHDQHGMPACARGGLSAMQLCRAKDLMVARIGGDITLGELAAAVGLSETHFSRAFKQSTGRSPFHWFADRRIEYAKDLLRSTARPIVDIALACGFSAQAAFTTAFRRATGCAPAQWRRAQRS